VKQSLLIVFALSGALTALAETSIELDPARTTVTFTLADVLHTVHGTFKLKRGSIQFDPASGKASGEIVVDVASGNSGGETRDKRMHKEILESARYPDAIFTPDHITGELSPQGESQLDVHGAFAIHGAAHETTFHFRTDVNGNDLTTSTDFVIPYVRWGMKNPSNFLLKVSDQVDVKVHAAGHIK